MNHQCCETVWRDAWHKTQCKRKARVIWDGQPYCTQHDPIRKAQLEVERFAKLHSRGTESNVSGVT